MPSWSASNPPPQKLATPAGTVATAVERARRLLERIVAGQPRDAEPPRPKH